MDWSIPRALAWVRENRERIDRFIAAWNEFLIAYVFLNDQEKQTLIVWLASFTTSRGTDWGPLMAGATLTALPVVVFFVLIHRKIAFGLTAGAVRG